MVNEIITFGQGYKLSPGIKVFVQSAKKICNNVTIICSGLSKDLTDYLENNKVNLIDAKELALKHNVQTNISPYTLKVIYFYLYVKNYSSASNVYLCDFTDIYFQKSPFDLIQNIRPYVTSENHFICNCETNTTWIKLCYNNDIYNLLKKYQIINGGSILGNRETVVNLLKEMCADMTQIISRIGNYQNIDQASLNKTIYFDQHRYNVLNDFEIINMAHFGNAKVDLNKEFITINGNVPHIIHQYDVIKTLENNLYVNHQ
jgi:hypothetical protein